jgi:MarR family 2-MHQ and catechol resistance regulon transcriptional repressor
MTNIQLLVVLQKMNNVFIKVLGKDLEERGMIASVFSILTYLNQVEKAKIQKLGEVAVITSGTITHVVNKLIKQNFIVKTQDMNDKRVYWIRITELGRTELLKVQDEHMKFLNELLSDFTEEEKLQFIEQIKYFCKTIEKKVRP